MPSALESLFGDARGEDPAQQSVQLTPDLKRILNMPQRDAAAAAALIVDRVSEALKTPQGTMALFPLQALALVEFALLGGGLALLPVGEGKTLVSYLLPVVFMAQRPVLLVPGAHLKTGRGGRPSKTVREFTELAGHWQGHPYYRMLSYEKVSCNPGLLEALDPDHIIADECDALKNPKAACTKRVRRYIQGKAKKGAPITFTGLSGTLANRSYKEWWHMQQWALPPELQPLPHSYPVLDSWCQALDEKLRARRPLGELWRLHHPTIPMATVEEVRSAFGRMLRGVPGIITAPGDSVKASLQFREAELDVPEVADALKTMRRTYCTPGGEEFSEASELWRHARELGNGFYYEWDPAPPDWWMAPRRVFHAFIRDVLKRSRTLDTMAQAVEAHLAHPDVLDWYAVRDKFTPNNVAVWLTNEVVEYAYDWAKKTGGLVWVEHRAVGEALQARGLPYFGQGALTAAGDSLLDHNGPAAVSAGACYRGYNLQSWNENLILNAPPLGRWYEQGMGRTHRQGQESSTVYFTQLFVTEEQRAGFEQACADAEYIEQTTSQRQKLCFADFV